MSLLSVANLSVSFRTRKGLYRCLDRLNFELRPGKVTALVGESGSGKSTLARTLLRTLPVNAVVDEESCCRIEGSRLEQLTSEQLRRLRWAKASMVFQAAQTALNPLRCIHLAFQDLREAHRECAAVDPRRLLEQVQLDPERVLAAYPHELSGGMRQRVVIAMALLFQPRLIILDEPTTALDVITAASIFSLLRQLQQELGVTMLFITHDLSAVAQLADDVGVLYQGRLLAFTDVDDFFYSCQEPYVRSLVANAPTLDALTLGGGGAS